METTIFNTKDTTVSKEGHVDSVLGHKKSITIDFLEKGSLVNCASNYQLIKQNLSSLLNDSGLYIIIQLLISIF